MFEQLIKEWADDQGFDTFLSDHATVMSNLASWLNQNVAQKACYQTAIIPCPHCDISVTIDSDSFAANR